MWKKLEDALYDNGKLRSRNDELEQEVEVSRCPFFSMLVRRVSGRRDSDPRDSPVTESDGPERRLVDPVGRDAILH